jgi:hypothetical protein
MVAHAVTYEPVFTGKFTANRENNREFSEIGSSGAAEALNNVLVPGSLRLIP